MNSFGGNSRMPIVLSLYAKRAPRGFDQRRLERSPGADFRSLKPSVRRRVMNLGEGSHVTIGIDHEERLICLSQALPSQHSVSFTETGNTNRY